MKLKPLICILAYLAFTGLFSQVSIELSYDESWLVTTKENEYFKRECTLDTTNQVFDGTVTDYRKEVLIMSGTYKSGLRNGDFKFYYPSGKLESEGTYTNNLRTGNWKYYHRNGQLKEKVLFSHEQLPDQLMVRFSILSAFDSNGSPTLPEGTGKWQLDSIPTILSPIGKTLVGVTGKFKDGLLDGWWELKHLESGNSLLKEKFKKGQFSFGVIPSAMGSKNTEVENLVKFPDRYRLKFQKTDSIELATSYPTFLEPRNIRFETILSLVTGNDIILEDRPAAIYPYGDDALSRFIVMNIRYPQDARIARVTGRVQVVATIGKNGEIVDSKIHRSVHESLDQEALRIVSLVEHWLPAVQNGEPVESTILIPITFRFGN